MSIGLTTAAYVVAAILFILALGGLSNQEKAKRAIWYGIIGMILAVVATVAGPGVGNIELLAAMVVIGGVVGWFVAKKVQMTQMPEPRGSGCGIHRNQYAPSANAGNRCK